MNKCPITVPDLVGWFREKRIKRFRSLSDACLNGDMRARETLVRKASSSLYPMIVTTFIEQAEAAIKQQQHQIAKLLKEKNPHFVELVALRDCNRLANDQLRQMSVVKDRFELALNSITARAYAQKHRVDFNLQARSEFAFIHKIALDATRPPTNP